jgi:hypothetical protein
MGTVTTTQRDETTGMASGRGAWQALADRLLAGAARYASPTGALLDFPGPASASGRWSDGLEGYARTFLLAAFRLRGAGGVDPHGLVERYASGLRAGVDPSSPERWPTVAERRQVVVEAASIAIALSETRPWLWDLLDDTDRQRVVAWLAGVVGTSGYTNNWIWFQNVIEAFLAEVGGPWNQADLDRNLEIQERLYIGDGWYSDGAGPTGVRQSFDYYAGWAWHVYPLLESRIRGTQLSSLHQDRLASFLVQARELVGTTGAPLLQGRSITYRFAMLAPFWAGAVAGVSPLSSGETRRLANGVLEHFLAAGSVTDDRLTIGWHREFRPVRQLYTGSASPYWASKGMLGLLLPDDHPEWTSTSPARDREAVSVRSLAAPGWLVVNSETDGVVRVLNHGSDGMKGPAGTVRADNPFYERIGFSNVTSPELSPAAIAEPLESHVALLDSTGAPSHRDAIERVHQGATVAVSRSRVHWLDRQDSDAAGWASLRTGPVVTCASVVHGVHELRLAWWTHAVTDPRPVAALDADSAWPTDPGPWRFRIGGWALPVREPTAESDGGTATRADGLTTTVLPVRGLLHVGTTVRTGSNPFAPVSITPWAAGTAPTGEGEMVAALVVLSGEPANVDAAVVSAVDVGADSITVRWRDGRTDVVPTDGEVRR